MKRPAPKRGPFCRAKYILPRALLAQGFKQHDGGGSGKSQRADGARHRDGEQAVFVAFVKIFGQAAGFRAEYQKSVGREGCVPIRGFAFGGEEKQLFFGGFVGFQEGVPRFVAAVIQVGPVVQPRAAYFFGGDFKPQSAHEVQARAGGHAGAADIAGIEGYFGVYEYDVKHRGYLSVIAGKVWQSSLFIK